MRLVLALVVSAVLLTPTSTFTADLAFLKSIVALQIPLPDANGIGYLATGCTASSIGDREWLTASHCVAAYTKVRYYIMGDEVTVVKYDAEKDLAKLTTRHATAPALKVSDVAPKPLDSVVTAGFPLGYGDLNASMGFVSGPQYVEIDGGYWPVLLFAMPGAPGMSGSPVLNENREIVSVVVMGYMRDTFSPQMGGVFYETLRAFLQVP